MCVCSCFPNEPIPIQTRVIILQHPNEVSCGDGCSVSQYCTSYSEKKRERDFVICFIDVVLISPPPTSSFSSSPLLLHSLQESRCLATVPLLAACLPKDKLHIVRGKVFRQSKLVPVTLFLYINLVGKKRTLFMVDIIGTAVD